MNGRFIGVRRAWREAARLGSFATAALVLSSAQAHAQTSYDVATDEPAFGEQAGGLSAELRAELDSYIQGALLAFDVPGAAVAVLNGGKVAYRGAFGVRGDGHPRAVDTRTLFMIGSISKSMTSTMIASLFDDGVVDWDDPVEGLLPTLELVQPEHASRVTLRHLLSHQSGLSRWDVSLFLGPERPLELIEEVGTIPMHAGPGERYEYQNQAFSLAGYAAARAAGARNTNGGLYRGYERLMRERVFEPVGMRRTTLDFDSAIRSENSAWPNEYSPLAGDVHAVQPDFERFATTVAPAGAVWSNVDDMARYLLLHMGDGRNGWGERVVSEVALTETHTPTALLDGGAYYGLGWMVLDSPFGRVLTHSGGTAGFGADVILVPEQGWGVVVLTNRASSFPFIQAVERYVLETLIGSERSPDSDLLAMELAFRAESDALMDVTAEVVPSDVAGLSGAYERGVRFLRRGPDLILRNDFGDLTMRAVVGYPGAFLSVGNTLRSGVAQFTSDEDGNVSVTVGLPLIEGDDVRLVQPVTLAKVQRPSSPHRLRRSARDPRAEWQRAVSYLRDCGVRAPTTRPFH